MNGGSKQKALQRLVHHNSGWRMKCENKKLEANKKLFEIKRFMSSILFIDSAFCPENCSVCGSNEVANHNKMALVVPSEELLRSLQQREQFDWWSLKILHSHCVPQNVNALFEKFPLRWYFFLFLFNGFSAYDDVSVTTHHSTDALSTMISQ